MSVPRRIVSLLPSHTETLFALGLGDRVVGVSHECDWPAAARGLPVLTAPKIDPAGTSAAIQSAVAGLASADKSVYSIDEARLAELRPDLIVTQDQCEVCAVSLTAVKDAVCRLGRDVPIIAANPKRLADIFEDMGRIGRAAGAEAEAGKLVRSLWARVQHVAHHARHARNDRPRPRVACIEWLEPLMLAGNWVPELVELAGGEPVGAAAGEHSAWIEWDAVVGLQPEAVFVMPCGFKLDQSRRELPGLTARPGWADLPAVKAGRTFAIDGNAYFNRPGPRIVDSLELLAGGLWPETFPEFARRDGMERF